MTTTRTERRERHAGRRRKLGVAIAAACVVLLGGAIALAVAGGSASSEREDGSAAGATDVASLAASAEDSAVASSGAASDPAAKAMPLAVEVPDVVGQQLVEAEMILTAAGLDVRRELVPTCTPDAGRRVLAQSPAAGEMTEAGAEVVLAHAPAPRAAPRVPRDRFVVCIDPGHQARANSALEPIGPGSSEKKPRVSGGTGGVSTKVPEYEIDLQISVRVKRRLEAAGVRVIMTRATDDVDLSNAERAAVANKAAAELFLRIHCDGNPDQTMSGASTLYPASNVWTRPIVKRSRRAAMCVQASMIRASGATDRGVAERADITGFNWSKVPSVLAECGFLSNPVEDRLLTSAAYQEKLAAGVAAGVLAYLGE